MKTGVYSRAAVQGSIQDPSKFKEEKTVRHVTGFYQAALAFAILTAGTTCATADSKCTDKGVYWSVAVSPDNTHIAAASGKHGCAEIINTQTGQRTSLRTRGGPVHTLVYSKDGQLLYLGHSRGIVTVIDPSNHRLVDQIGGVSPFPKISLGKDENYLATGGVSFTARLIELKTKSVIKEFGNHRTVTGIEISPETRYVAISEIDGLDLWDIEKKILIKEFFKGGDAFSAAFSPDEKLLFVAVACKGDSCNRNVRSINLSDLTISELPLGTAKTLEVTPNGKFLISGHVNGDLYSWNLSNKHKRKIGNAGAPIASMDISKGSRYIAVGTWEGGVQLWDIDKRTRTMFQKNKKLLTLTPPVTRNTQTTICRWFGFFC